MSTSDEKKAKVDLKVILLGCSSVGKTCLINRYIKDEFGNVKNTIGASFALKNWNNFNMGIWDTAGQEKYTSLSGFYTRGAGAAILTYDVTCKQSFDELERYIKLLDSADPNCYVVLVASKVDLLEEFNDKHNNSSDSNPTELLPRAVPIATGKAFAAAHGYGFFETSAKTGLNVAAVFDDIGKHCLSHLPQPAAAAGNSRQAVSSLSSTLGNKNSSSNFNNNNNNNHHQGGKLNVAGATEAAPSSCPCIIM